MSKDDEKVMAVPVGALFATGRWQGLQRENLEHYLALINQKHQFLRRGDAETDTSFKQIIPYILFSCNGSFFVYTYLAKAGEQRLVGNYQIGVGGHINEEDVGGSTDALEAGMMREWEEEVDYRGNILEKRFIGLLNDDSRPVEQVHLGLVYHIVGDSPEISIKETEKMEGRLVPLEKIGEMIKDNPGVWIKIAYEQYLKPLIQ